MCGGGRGLRRALSLKDARNQFFDIIDRAGRLSERVVVTKNGRPEAVVMGADGYDSWVETLAWKVHSFKDAVGEEQ
jgi:prevent-host-death family protein